VRGEAGRREFEEKEIVPGTWWVVADAPAVEKRRRSVHSRAANVLPKSLILGLSRSELGGDGVEEAVALCYVAELRLGDSAPW